MRIDGGQIQNAIYIEGESPWPVGAAAWEARAREVLEPGRSATSPAAPATSRRCGRTSTPSTVGDCVRGCSAATRARRIRRRARHAVAGAVLPCADRRLSIAHADGELAAARAAAALRIPFIALERRVALIEEIAEAMGDAPRWFQLYWVNDREICESFVARAEAAGYARDRRHAGHADARLAAARPRATRTCRSSAARVRAVLHRSRLLQPPRQAARRRRARRPRRRCSPRSRTCG